MIRRHRQPGGEYRAGGPPDFRRARDNDGQPVDPGLLRRRDAPLRPFLTMVGVGISSLNLVATQVVQPRRGDRNRSIEQIRGRLMASVMWAIQIIESIKATGSESDLLVRWAAIRRG